MRRHLLLAIACMAVLSLLSLATGAASYVSTGEPSTTRPEGSFVSNEILIGVRPEMIQSLTRQVTPSQTGITSLDQLNERYTVQQMSPVFMQVDSTDPIARRLGLAGIFKLTVPVGTEIFAMIAEYQTDTAIAYAEPNLVYGIADIPNDTDFAQQWALHNTGQTGGSPDADIDAVEAWDIEKGKSTVLVAIVDTGVNYNHPELVGGRVRTDIDRDFVNGDDDAMDDHGHGTYCAGVAAANTNNESGIAGVCQGCQILPVKVLDSGGSGTAESVAQGIQYAAQAGARVISMSLGYASNCGCSQTVARTINYAFESGSLLIAASGNDSDKTRLSYPASSPRVMSVGASDHTDQEADFSNRSDALDIMAPGVDVYSLDLDGGYRTASGTSAAAPHVSGTAGLILSARPTLSNAQVWWILYQSADDLPGMTASLESISLLPHSDWSQTAEMSPRIWLPVVLKGRTTFGRLNAYSALGVSFVGHVSALEDTCNSEPSCPPECAAEIVLDEAVSGSEYVRLLREFRDGVLEPSPIGQRWVALYEKHRFESALIMLTDRQFRSQTRLALSQWMPLFQALVSADAMSDQQATLSSEQAEALEIVISGFMARGSSRLRSDLGEVEQTLQVRRYVGWDIRDAWHDLNSQH